MKKILEERRHSVRRAPRVPRELAPVSWPAVLAGMLVCALTVATLLAGCGGGEPEPPPCGADFVGPLLPGTLPPGCEAGKP